MIDLHVHTALCGHADGTLDEYVVAAARAGVATMAFCDHLPLPEGFCEAYTMREAQLPVYVADVSAVRASAAERGGPDVLLGIEADHMPGDEGRIAAALRENPFDVVLGSVHFIDDWAFDDPDLREGYEGWDADALWERYFDELCAAAASGLYDVMAHPDLVKKFGCAPSADPTGHFERAAEAFARAGVAVEVNTAGLRKPCAEIYPSQGFLEACRRRGVPATVGSDAHRPEDVGAGWAEAVDLLRAAGYRSVVTFRGRRAEEVAL